MKHIVLLSMFVCIELISTGQTITGKVVSMQTGRPLMYASIGIVNTRFGTIANEKGEFTLSLKDISPDLTLKISMIGYEAKSFKLKELSDQNNTIELEQKTVNIEEVIVNSGGVLRTVGTKKYSMHRVCGWGGDRRGQGHEIGTAIDLGQVPVRLEKLHIHIHKQSFDSSLFRLHIRTIKDKLPNEELLNEDIILPVSGYKGWVEFDLNKYNIVLKGEVALSLEWLKVVKLNPKKLISVNGKPKSANVLFSMKKKKGVQLHKVGS
jgi:hypothetical protein